jgi:glucose/arabinose dehydrogenase
MPSFMLLRAVARVAIAAPAPPVPSRDRSLPGVPRLPVLVAATLLAVTACGGGSRPETGARPATSPPTSPAPTTRRATTSTTRGPAPTTGPTATPAPTTPSTPPATTDLAAVRVALAPVASGLRGPVALAWRAGDARMYVAEQPGTVRVVGADGRPAVAPVLSLDVSRGNEQGLLGLAFSPDGTKLYVHYTDPNGDTRVVEYTMRGDVADPQSRRELLFQDQPYSNHNGGQVVFGPDGMLYITLGDGGSGGDPQNNAPNLGTLLGKILRINPRPPPGGGAPYTVPADNPFAARRGVRTEIWMYGLRNPWRFSFDRATGDVWIGDVGQNAYEEIDFAPAGQSGIDWGWSAREGFHRFRGDRPPGARDPIVETGHGQGECAVVGGYVYRGRAIASLQDVYVFGDNCRPELVAVLQRDGRAVAQRDLGVQVPDLTTFGEDPAGELYAASRGGTVYRVVVA